MTDDTFDINDKTQRITVLRGLPGSGKTTFAYKWVEADPDFRIRVNKDDIRYSLYKRYWNFNRHQTENINAQEYSSAETAIKALTSPIIDATNMSADSIHKWYSLGAKYHIPVEVIWEPFDLPIEKIKSRDMTRTKFVGPKVIDDFVLRYYKKGKMPAPPKPPETFNLEAELVVVNPALAPCYLFDVDGTLARIDRTLDNPRSPFDEKRVLEDLPVENVIRVAQILSESYPLIVMSGRTDYCKDDTSSWLASNGINFKEIHMRKSGDTRPDDVVKLELFNENVRENYNVLGVFDDRLKVCRMWEQIGLTLFRVGPIDSDF